MTSRLVFKLSLSFSLLVYKSYVLVVPKLVYIPYSMDITAFVNNVSGL